MTPLWEVLDELVPAKPAGPVRSAIWRYEDIKDLVLQAGDLISAAEAVRRVLILENPGLPGSSAITRSLYAGLQLVLPGEVAPCHKHAQSALRFVLDGKGAFTAIDGERIYMEPFDLVLTPSGRWHDHGNETDQPIIWLDGLDIPLISTLDCGYVENLSTEVHPPTGPAGDNRNRYGANMRPVPTENTAGIQTDGKALLHYPYSVWRETLDKCRLADTPDPHTGYKMEFINPTNAGPAMSTISAFVQLLPGGFETTALCSSDATVYSVCEGAGWARIGEETYEFGPRDVFVVPSWQPFSLIAADAETVLFSFSDRAVQRILGLWRQAFGPFDGENFT